MKLTGLIDALLHYLFLSISANFHESSIAIIISIKRNSNVSMDIDVIHFIASHDFSCEEIIRCFTFHLWSPHHKGTVRPQLPRPVSCWYKSQLEILGVRLTSLKVANLISARNNHSKLPTRICVDLGKNQKMYKCIHPLWIKTHKKGKRKNSPSYLANPFLDRTTLILFYLWGLKKLHCWRGDLEENLNCALQKNFEWLNLSHSLRTNEPEVKSKRLI